MRRRKLLLVLVGLAVVLCAVSAFVLWPGPHRITEENFDRIREGMSRAEVEAILGPPGDYTTGPTVTEVVYYPPFPAPRSDRSVQLELVYPDYRCPDLDPITGKPLGPFWHGDTGTIAVCFDDAGRVTSSSFGACKRVELSVPANLVWRLRRLRHHWFPE